MIEDQLRESKARESGRQREREREELNVERSADVSGRIQNCDPRLHSLISSQYFYHYFYFYLYYYFYHSSSLSSFSLIHLAHALCLVWSVLLGIQPYCYCFFRLLASPRLLRGCPITQPTAHPISTFSNPVFIYSSLYTP